ncbi:MAG: flippase-like domain-containing protein [Planctomycetes bacterium]|nr:flippase-like domain-containing protein [Planctomycetota bacterium]
MKATARKYLWLAVRVLVSAACIFLVVRQLQWSDLFDEQGNLVSQGVVTLFGNVFRNGNWWFLVPAVLSYMLSPVFGAWRWRMLLRIQGIRLTFLESWRLTYIGFFFNTFMPGVTGGDIVKAYYASKCTDRKAEAVATVFLDRVLGMLGMGLLCICVLAMQWRSPAIADARWHLFGGLGLSIREVILAFLGFAALGALVVYSRRVRRWLQVERLINRLPFQKMVKRLDEAVFIYRHHRVTVLAAILQSWCAHAVSIASVYFSARALGLDPSPVYFFIFMPLVWILSSFIPSVGGLGPMEGLSQEFFTAAVLGLPGQQAALSQAVNMIVLFRLVMFAAVLPGGWLHIRHSDVSMRQARSEMENMEGGDG